MEKLKAQHRSIYLKLIPIGADLLLQKNLHECLKIPPRRPLSDFLPELTLIFIDQVDFLIDFKSSSLSEQLELYLTGLAANSVNSKLFKIIICVSKPEVTTLRILFIIYVILIIILITASLERKIILIMMLENISLSI